MNTDWMVNELRMLAAQNISAVTCWIVLGWMGLRIMRCAVVKDGLQLQPPRVLILTGPVFLMGAIIWAVSKQSTSCTDMV